MSRNRRDSPNPTETRNYGGAGALRPPRESNRPAGEQSTASKHPASSTKPVTAKEEKK